MGGYGAELRASGGHSDHPVDGAPPDPFGKGEEAVSAEQMTTLSVKY
jgi:hypothetical protein